jgi:amino-acid N-acetyltransferase
MRITTVTQDNFSKALALINKCNLPTEDITGTTKLFAAIDNNKVLGTIGVEVYGSTALLRSFAVMEEARSKGIGNELLLFLEEYIKQNGIKKLALLTTTAAEYFARKGFQILDRENTPVEITGSSEFKSTCPSSAIVMKKDL